ncbi:hypothetical protein [Pseudomonas mohnii]
MSEVWVERKRRTNYLVRAIAGYLFEQHSVTPDQIFGLCKLTWITNSFCGEDAKYIKSTKIPALEVIFDRDYSKNTLQEVAADIANILNSPEVEDLILNHTGFTNFYKAYRNTAREWVEKNFDEILPLFKSAYQLQTDEQGIELARYIENQPGLPKANHEELLMRPQYFLTPAFFALDQRLRFPLINGNAGVKRLLSVLGVQNEPLAKQYETMIRLYGEGGIEDAADLDQAGGDLPDFIKISGNSPTKQFLQKKPTEGNALPLKDESDIESLQQARTVINKRLHNGLTNKLKYCLSEYTLLEGCDKAAQFDVMVKNYNGCGDDLLIEAKSSVEIAHVRMAVGQLYDYWFRLKGCIDHHLAVLLPNEPDDGIKSLLAWLGVGVLWFRDDVLETCSNLLEGIAYQV